MLLDILELLLIVFLLGIFLHVMQGLLRSSGSLSAMVPSLRTLVFVNTAFLPCALSWERLLTTLFLMNATTVAMVWAVAEAPGEHS